MSSRGKTLAYGLHLFGQICTSQIATEMGRTAYALHGAVSKRAKMLKFNSNSNIFFGSAKTKTDHPISNIPHTEENRRYQNGP